MLTAQAIKEDFEVLTIVDNRMAQDNVTDFARSQGFAVSTEEKNDRIYLTLKKTIEKPKK